MVFFIVSNENSQIKILYNKGEFEKLVKELDTGNLRIASEEDRILYASSLSKLGRVENSVRQFQEIAQKWPKDRNTYNLATMLAKAGRFSEACDAYFRLSNSKYKEPEILLQYSSCLAQVKGVTEAADFLLDKYNKSSDIIFLKHKLSLQLQHYDLPNARVTITELEGITNDPLSYKFEMAKSLIVQGEYLAAKKLLLELTERFPTEIKVFTHLGDLCLRLRKHQEAINCFLHTAKLDPNYSGAYQNVATVLKEVGTFEAALKYALKARDLDPKDPNCYNLLGILYRKTSMLTRSKSNFIQAIEIDGSNGEYHNNLANTYMQLYEYREAIKHYSRALTINPGLQAAFHSLCECHLGMGSLTEYRDLIEQIPKRDNYQVKKENCKLAVILTHGRTGSLFLHSLLDSHPQIITIPGVYLQGWFSDKLINALLINPINEYWREELIERVLDIFEPMFSAKSTKNVPGRPLGETANLAKAQGLDNFQDSEWEYELNSDTFRSMLLVELKKHNFVSHAKLLTLIFHSFHKAYYGTEITKDMIILYHIHNPPEKDLHRLKRSFADLKIITTCREPIQNLESWIELLKAEKDGKVPQFRRVHVLGRIESILMGYIHRMGLNDGLIVKLEDLKESPEDVLKKLCKFLDIEFMPSILNPTFIGRQYIGPKSQVEKKVLGFNNTALKAKKGRIFPRDDLEIFELLFWKSKLDLGYNVMSRDSYERKIRELNIKDLRTLSFEDGLYKHNDAGTEIGDGSLRLALANLLTQVFLYVSAKSA